MSGHNPRVLAFVEGQLTITSGDEIFFSESGTLLLELGVELVKWLNTTRGKSVPDFRFVTMDYDEGPILSFSNCGNGCFSIDSPWKQTDRALVLPGNLLISSIEQFISRLRAALQVEFGIDIRDFV